MSQGQRVWVVIVSVLLIGLNIGGCMSPPSSPARTFTTTDLLIDPSLLPSEWAIAAGPTGETPHSLDSLGFPNNRGGSHIDLREPACRVTGQCVQSGSSADQLVIKFRNTQDAARSYRGHVFTSDTEGQYATTWKLIADFAYRSPVADQFRVMCGTTRNINNIGGDCAIEAQYAEFLSIVLYSTLEADRVQADLETLAKAVDARMEHYLKQDEGK
jgi:hypothetical protein